MTGATRRASRAGYGAGAFAVVFTLLAAFSGSEAFGDGTVIGDTPPYTGAGSTYAPNLYDIQTPVSEQQNEQLAKTLAQTYARATDTAWQTRKAQDAGQVGTWQQVKDGFGDTAIATTYDMMHDEGVAGGLGQIGHKIGTWLGDMVGVDFGESNYNKQEHAEELLQGIPVEYWDGVMQYDNLGAAQRARGRILADLERQKRMSLQRGGGAAFASFLGKSPDYLLAALGIFLCLLFVSRKKGARFPHLDRADW